MSQIQNFIARANAFSTDVVKTKIEEIASEFDARIEYEATQKQNDKIIDKLNKARAAMTNSSIARFMLAANVDVSFINKARRSTARFNVYSIQKVQYLARSVMLNSEHNDVNLHVLRSMFKAHDKKVEFTSHLASAAVSDKITIDAKYRSILSRHTVSTSTASTQKSSTINALLITGIISQYKNDKQQDCYKLNDNDLVTCVRETVK